MKNRLLVLLTICLLLFGANEYALAQFGGGGAFGSVVDYLKKVGTTIKPAKDDTYDLGSSSREWRNLYIDGTANIDSLSVGIGLFADGTAAAPSISFISDTDTGLFRLTADELSLGAGGTEGLRIDANESEVQPMMTLATGPIELEEDSGAVTAINLPVSATPADGDEESMTFAIDSNAVLKIYGEADSSGGTDTHKVVISDAVITGGGLQLNHQTLTAATLTLDANDGVVECDTTSNAIAITLPECSTVLGQTLTIYFETDNANDVVVTTAAGDTYADVGDLGDNTATMADAGDFIVIQAVSDTRWVVIENNGATLSTV